MPEHSSQLKSKTHCDANQESEPHFLLSNFFFFFFFFAAAKPEADGGGAATGQNPHPIQ